MRVGICLILLACAHATPSRAGTRAASRVLINALHNHGREGSADEAVQLVNVSDQPVQLGPGWSLAAAFGGGVRSASLPTRTLAPGETLWIAHDAAAFTRQFGEPPGLSFTDLQGGVPVFANGAGWVRLLHADNPEPEDALAYGPAMTSAGWVGPALLPYGGASLQAGGQFLMRRFDPRTGLPTPDTDSVADWLNAPVDAWAGRPVFPGWQMSRFAMPARDAGALTLALAPDGSHALVAQSFEQALRSIDIESFTFEHAGLGLQLARKVAQGVRVRVLLDGAPPGGLSTQTLWICAQLHAARRIGDAQSGCRFMRSDAAQHISNRYRFLHAKFVILDDQALIVSSENFGPRGMPDDDPADGTLGHRGALIRLDAPALVARAREIFAADADLAQRDVALWCPSGCEFGPPPTGFQPANASGGDSYTVRAGPLVLSEPVSMSLSTSPESHLGVAQAFALVEQTGAGDEVLVQQLDEPPFWGPAAPELAISNPRLLAYIAAARRGATVHVMLDNTYDRAAGPNSNAASVARLNALGIPTLHARLANPAGLGIHNKMLLIQAGARRYVHIGSWNGSEVSAKLNREMSVLIESDSAHAWLRAAFYSDLSRATPVYLPLITAQLNSTTYLLISEVMVDAPGDDAHGEWVEIYNPAPFPVSLAGYKLGDAVRPMQNASEGMRKFPENAVILAHGSVVVAADAMAFFDRYHRNPDFELGGYDPVVPDMEFYPAWAAGSINLGNTGDEIALLRKDDTIEDVVGWLAGQTGAGASFGGEIVPGTSLQRWPVDGDSGDCGVDFRSQPVPSPGVVP